MLKAAKEAEFDYFKGKAIEQLSDKAKTGYYHSYKSPILFPKSELVEELQKLGLNEIADLVISGEFDEDPEPGEEVKIKPYVA